MSEVYTNIDGMATSGILSHTERIYLDNSIGQRKNSETMTDSQSLSGRGRKPGKIVGDTFRHAVAGRIRDRRLELQLRAEDAAAQVAEQLGRPVNVQTWYHWEKAEHPFDIDALPAIAKALKCSPRELLPEEPVTESTR